MWWKHINAHTHTYCLYERWGLRSQLNSHLTSLTHTKTQPGVFSRCYLQPPPIPRDCTWEREIVSWKEREKGPWGRKKEVRGWKRTEDEDERGQAGESQQAVSVEVIMRHWSEPHSWHDEIHEVCLSSSLSHCLSISFLFLWPFLLIVYFCFILFFVVVFYYQCHMYEKCCISVL